MFINSKEAKRIGHENLDYQWGSSLLTLALYAILLACGNVVPVIGSMAVLGALNYGRTYIYYRASMKEDINFWDIFKGFENDFGDNFLASVLVSVFSMLWGLIFIVPGIIKSYSYSMTIYLLMREPELNAQQALAKSIKVMHGHKWRLFMLDLSFLGWTILEVITCGLVSVYVAPYKQHAHMAFYNNLYDNYKEEPVVAETVEDKPEFNIDPDFLVDADVTASDFENKPEE